MLHGLKTVVLQDKSFSCKILPLHIYWKSGPLAIGVCSILVLMSNSMTPYAQSAYATDMEDMTCEHLGQRFTDILKNSHEQPFHISIIILFHTRTCTGFKSHITNCKC